MLPAFVDATHCLPYHLTSTGRAVADRIVNVLGYDCPDITYSPVLYPITSLLLHFMSGKCRLTSLCLTSVHVTENEIWIVIRFTYTILHTLDALGAVLNICFCHHLNFEFVVVVVEYTRVIGTIVNHCSK